MSPSSASVITNALRLRTETLAQGGHEGFHMRLRLSSLSVALVLAAGVSRVHAELIDIAWDAQGRFDKVSTVPPGKFVEVCGKLARGIDIEWAFDADRPGDFNIHYHLGKEVVFPARQSAVARATGTLEVKSEQDYCWMWTNKSDSVARLELRLSRLAQRFKRSH